MPRDFFRDANNEVMADTAVLERLLGYRREQAAARGEWPDPTPPEGDPDSAANFTFPPFPEPKNPMLDYLVAKAVAEVEMGEMGMREMVTWLAVHAWMEGHVEGYDRGQAEARAPRSV